MKRSLKNQIRCLLAVSLLLVGTIPSQALEPPAPPRLLASIEELLQWYGGLSGDTPQEGGVSKPIVSSGEVVLSATPCRVDIVLLGGLRVPAGARLTIDNPNLALYGLPPAIIVEPGGVLHIRRWCEWTPEAMPKVGAIVVQAGGTLLLEPGITLPEGMVTDQNLPPNNLLPPTTTPPTMPDETPLPETPLPETPPAEETLSIKGEVLKVSAGGGLLAMLTLPLVDPAFTETVVIERSADAQVWNTEYSFRWNEVALGFISDETPEFGRMVSKNRIDGSKTDFKYLARLSGKPFYLRVTETTTEGRQMVSNEIYLTEPSVGLYPSDDDYEDSGGNRGGGGQGSTDREEQQTEAAVDDGDLPEMPQSTVETANVVPPPDPAPQSTATTQPVMEQQPHPDATQASSPAQAVQAVVERPKRLDGTMRNGVVIAATLALCGAIWIFTTKRKKS